MGRGKSVYTIAEKQMIVEEAYSAPDFIKRTARKYNIQPVQIREWKIKLSNIADHHKSKKMYRPKESIHVEREDVYNHLEVFFEAQRALDHSVSIGSLVNEVVRFDRDFLKDNPRALRKRIERFAVRLDLVHRRRTHVAQNTRHSEEIINDFVLCVKEHISMLGLPPSAVVNIDETNIDFDMPSTTTLERRGARTVSVRGTGSSQRATVLLGVAMDGSKLPPFIVWKGKRSGMIIREVTSQALNHGYPEDLVMSVQKNGWMDEELMLEWTERVWKPWVTSRGFINKASLLIMDKFAGHMVGKVVDALGDCGTDLEFIVGGYTSKLQVLDVGINRPFKAQCGKEFEKFIQNNPPDPVTKKQKKPHRKDVAAWVVESWSAIREDTILNTWRRIGISV